MTNHPTTLPVSRRSFLGGLGFITLAQTWPFRLAMAAAPTDKRLLLVILRGAMDGLGAVVPYSDPAYHDIRGKLAMEGNSDDLIAINSDFAFAKALAPVSAMYAKGEAAFMHATATPYRSRSHFDAQDLLENGSIKPMGLGTGWLNRTLDAMHGKGIAIGPTIPLVMRGPASIASWSPSILPEVDDDFMARAMRMYDDDELLHNALAQTGMASASGMDKNAKGQRAFIPMMQKAAEFLSGPSGARVGSIDIGGWDTHAQQGTGEGRLATNLAILAEGLSSFKTAMGTEWNNTALLVVTEFGRTARPNGTGGTDHGTGTTALVLGGRVNGGRMLGDWPGMGKLYEDRDLLPANDLRSLLKGTLAQHLGIPDEVLTASIFPDSAAAKPTPNLFRPA